MIAMNFEDIMLSEISQSVLNKKIQIIKNKRIEEHNWATELNWTDWKVKSYKVISIYGCVLLSFCF